MIIKSVITIIIVLLLLLILFSYSLFDENKDSKHKKFVLNIVVCLITSLFILLQLLWHNPACKNYVNLYIADEINTIAFMMTVPLLYCIYHQLWTFRLNIWKRKLHNKNKIADLLIIIDSIIIFVIIVLYLFVGILDLTNRDAHGLFPLVLGCAISSLFPFFISVYMYISSHINWPLCLKDKRELLDICTSGGLESLSMLGISLTFDSILYTADKYLSVSLVYWSTYFFMIISLLIITVNVINKINARLHFNLNNE